MSRTQFVGSRMAEFQFGRIVFGWFQFVWFLPVYFKIFGIGWSGLAVLVLVVLIAIWVTGFLAYRFGLVRHFRKKEFGGLL